MKSFTKEEVINYVVKALALEFDFAEIDGKEMLIKHKGLLEEFMNEHETISEIDVSLLVVNIIDLEKEGK